MRGSEVIASSALLLLASCSTGAPLALPPEIRWLAVAPEAAAADARLAIVPAGVLGIPRDSAALLLGFAATDFRDTAPPDEAQIGSFALRHRHPCDPPLRPSAMWRFSEDRVQPLDPSELPYAPTWLDQPDCTPAGPVRIIGARTGPGPCRGRLESVSRCPTAVPDCSPITAQALPSGQLCITDGVLQCLIDANDRADASCDALSASEAAVRESLAFDRTELRVLDVQNAAPGPDFMPGQRTRAGYLRDLVLLPDRAVVLAGGGGLSDPRACSGTSQFHFHELETLAPIGTASAPPCLGTLLADPAGGFVGVYPELDRLRIARFDARGRQLSSTPIASDPELGPEWPVEIVELDASTIALLLAEGGPETSHQTARLVFIKADSFERISSVWARIGPCYGLAAVADGAVALACVNGCLYQVSSGLPLLLPSCLHGTSPQSLAYDPAVGRLIAADEGPTISTYAPTLDRSEISSLFAPDQLSTAVTRWPGQLDRYLVSSYGASDWQGGLSLYRAGSLARPTSDLVPVGFGRLGPLRFDQAGRIWSILPWSARLIRLTPR